MENRDKLLDIIKKLNDNRSKLSALYSLYNSSLLMAENDRADLSSYYEQMIDLRNNVNEISTAIYNAKKTERSKLFTKNKSKIKLIGNQVNEANDNFSSSCKKYKLALKDCGSLKTEYKHEVSALCKEFKSIADENVDAMIIKGYKQQVKIIKAILDKIELLIADYNVKKNKVEQDNERFTALYGSVATLIEKLQSA
ncbi:MAG: hypothetical protein IKM43_01450 [Clostridia bacterium]|nr:hypothetical protein [Clostridia bacterium]